MTSNQESLIPRNPVAPLPAEHEEICRLIERDESLLEFLMKEKEEREIIVAQNGSKEAIAADCLTAINIDLARATQFHDILVEALKNIETFEDHLGAKASTSHRPHDADHLLPNLANRTPTSRIANDYHSSTKEHLLEIEAAIEKATSTASHYREEVQAAKSLISMTLNDIIRIQGHIVDHSAAIVAKKFCLKAIWRMPDEIWGLIFQHSTGTTSASVSLNDDWVRGNISWHGALVISGVCQRWRYIAIATPRLWANITVFRGAFRAQDLSRVQYHIERAGESAKTLLLGGTLENSNDQFEDLRSVMEECAFVDRIICRLVRNESNSGLTSVLNCLRSVPEIWLLSDQPQTESSLNPAPWYYISIPNSLAIGIERLATESILVSLGSQVAPHPRLHSCSITCSSILAVPNADLFFNTTIGWFLASWLPTLKDLRLCTPRFTRGAVGHVTKTVLEALHIELQCLLVEFAPRYTMPSLRTLVITGGFDATSVNYELSKPRLPLGTLQSLTIESTAIVGPLSALILDSTSLTSLELRGDSVDIILSSLVENYRDTEKPFLASLRRFIIDSYDGVGGSVLEFLLAWKASHAANPRPLELILFANECPSVTLETRKQLCSLAGGVVTA